MVHFCGGIQLVGKATNLISSPPAGF